MSVKIIRSSKRSNTPNFFSPADASIMSSAKVRSAKKIRRTQDMIHLDLTCDESVSSRSLKKGKHSLKSTNKNDSILPAIEQESAINEAPGRRKIVKAKRLLRKNNQVQNTTTDADFEEKNESSILKTDLIASKKVRHCKSGTKLDLEATSMKMHTSFDNEESQDRSLGEILIIKALEDPSVLPEGSTDVRSSSNNFKSKNCNKKITRNTILDEEKRRFSRVSTSFKETSEITLQRVQENTSFAAEHSLDRSVSDISMNKGRESLYTPDGNTNVLSSSNNANTSNKRTPKNKLIDYKKRRESFLSFHSAVSTLKEIPEKSLHVEKDTSFSADRSVGDLLIVETAEIPEVTGVSVSSLHTSFTQNLDAENAQDQTTPVVASKNQTSDFLMVTTLPSPISPSERSSEDISSSKSYLNFRSSQENLLPSTSGAVPIKRRTYELEDSVIDISSLKSLSEKDSKRLSSVSSNDCQTPDGPTFSKITTRRRWNKSNNFSPFLSDKSPTWVKHDKTPECIVVTDSAETKKSKKFVSKVKIPNFAAIHQKALEKIENLSEYKDRKEQRAKMLLAGLKPQTGQKSTKKTPKINSGESRKQLRFAPEICEREKSPTFIPLPSTPKPKTLPPPTPPQRPFLFQFDNKENRKGRIPVPVVKKGSPQVKPFTQPNAFAFKGKNPDAPHMKEIKSLTTKSKTTTVDSKEARRCAIKGVRSNRRFELLMNMRKGK